MSQEGMSRRRSRSPGKRRRTSRAKKAGGQKDKKKGKRSKSRSRAGQSASLGLFKKTMIAASVSAAAKFSSSLGDDRDTDRSKHGEPGEFPLYLLAQSWGPRFCCTSQKRSEPT